MEGNPQAKGTGGQEERLDLIGHVETQRLDSLRAPGPITNTNPPAAPMPRDQHEPEGRPETEDGGNRRSNREATSI